MAAGERGAGEHAQAVEIGPGTVDRQLDQVHEQELAADDDREEEHDRGPVESQDAVGSARECEQNDHRCRTELRDQRQQPERESGHVAGRPPGDVFIDRHHARIASDHVDEDTDDRASNDETYQGGGQSQTGGDGGIEPRPQESNELPPMAQSVRHRAGRCGRWVGLWPAPNGHPRDRTGESAYGHRDQECHRPVLF